MKKVVLKKTAAVLVLMMILSALSPLLALASTGFKDGAQSYNSATGNVTAKVYITDETYSTKAVYLNSDNQVVIHVYRANEAKEAAKIIYASYKDGSYNFDGATTVTGSTYLTLKYFYNNGTAVTTQVYNSYNPIPGYTGGGTTPPVNSDGSVNADALKALFAANKNATLEVSTDVVNLPASALIAGETLTLVKADGTSYTLPIAALKLEEQAKSLGVDLNALTIRVTIQTQTGAAADAVSSAVSAIGATAVAGAVDFKVAAVAGSKEVAIEKFGQLVSRTLPLNAGTTTTNATGVLYNPTTKAVSFVPSTFETKDGKTLATLKRDGNSIYTVVQVPAVNFTDMLTHWAKKDVTTLAQKLIVEGTGANKFEPNRNITRAEFAALIVRSLGIETSSTNAPFSDVASSKWYAGAVAAAADAGLITGYEDKTFRPNANITRKEVATLVVRAMKYAGKELKLTDAEATAALANFTDASTLGWAKADVAAAVQAGLVQGQSATKIAGNSNATRAESATLIARYLTNAALIN